MPSLELDELNHELPKVQEDDCRLFVQPVIRV